MTLPDRPQRNFKLICLPYSKTNVLQWISPCTSCSWCDKANFKIGECTVTAWMAETAWSQQPNRPWVLSTENVLFCVAEKECISLVMWVQAWALAWGSDFTSLVPSLSFQAEVRSQGVKLPGNALLWKAAPAESLERGSNTLSLPLSWGALE